MILNEPLLKWPGGKSTEYRYIKDVIPMYARYIEPFFGGGAVFFKEQPQQAFINDIAPELIAFYRHIKREMPIERLVSELDNYRDSWDNLHKVFGEVIELAVNIYDSYSRKHLPRARIENMLAADIQKSTNSLYGSVGETFLQNRLQFEKHVTGAVARKLMRTAVVEARSSISFSLDELARNMETGVRSGFYTHFRDILNDSNNEAEPTAIRIANWYFIREYCYGSMFRYNAKGHFNVPYGGMAYNRKSLGAKISKIASEAAYDAFRNVEIHNLDFEAFLHKVQPSNDDFIFLDPPYDTEFSSYEGAHFTATDHERLADFLASTPAQALMIIKSTPFIDALYCRHRDLTVESFEKNYTYNVRGRNIRLAEHLIIRNF